VGTYQASHSSSQADRYFGGYPDRTGGDHFIAAL
jgi:hypothetical protein